MPTQLASLGGPRPQHAGGSEDGGLGRKNGLVFRDISRQAQNAALWQELIIKSSQLIYCFNLLLITPEGSHSCSLPI